MLINLKQYIEPQKNPKARSYTLGVSTDTTYIDQKRNIIPILPGRVIQKEANQSWVLKKRHYFAL